MGDSEAARRFAEDYGIEFDTDFSCPEGDPESATPDYRKVLQ